MKGTPDPIPEPLEYATPGVRRSKRTLLIFISLISGLIVISAVAGFIPGLARPRFIGNRIRCDSNLRQIGQAILLYTRDSHGIYPDSFETILASEDLTSAVFVCPDSNDNPATGATTQAVIANLSAPGNCSYFYVGKNLTTQSATWDVVVAYEPMANHNYKGMNVLFGDGNVQFLTPPQGRSILSQINAGKWPVKFSIATQTANEP